MNYYPTKHNKCPQEDDTNQDGYKEWKEQFTYHNGNSNNSSNQEIY